MPLLFGIAVTTGVRAQGTAFHFQGVVKLADGTPINGPCDLNFQLMDAPTGGNYVGDVLFFNHVPVSNGLLSIDLDFGPVTAAGQPLWMAISMKTSAASLYEPLSPRYAILSVPSAQFAARTAGFSYTARNETLDQQQAQVKSGVACGVPDCLAQSFTAGASGPLSRIDIMQFLGVSETTGTMNVYAGRGTGGTLLASEPFTLHPQGITTAITFHTPPQLTAGNAYTFTVNLAQALDVAAGPNNSYPGGQMEGGAWAPGSELFFRTYILNGGSVSALAADRVGIGTMSPERALHVASPSGICIGQNSGSGGYTALVMNLSQTSGGYASIMSVKAAGQLGGWGDLVVNPFGGNVGVATSSPQYTLDVNGIIRATNVSVTSDARLKKDIQPLTGALDSLLRLHGVSFAWRPDALPGWNPPEGRQIGFLAQDVEKVLPELVSTDAKGYKSVSYQNVVPLLVEGMREQEATVGQLKGENATLRSQNAALAARLDRLEKQMDRLLSRR